MPLIAQKAGRDREEAEGVCISTQRALRSAGLGRPAGGRTFPETDSLAQGLCHETHCPETLGRRALGFTRTELGSVYQCVTLGRPFTRP